MRAMTEGLFILIPIHIQAVKECHDADRPFASSAARCLPPIDQEGDEYGLEKELLATKGRSGF